MGDQCSTGYGSDKNKSSGSCSTDKAANKGNPANQGQKAGQNQSQKDKKYGSNA